MLVDNKSIHALMLNTKNEFLKFGFYFRDSGADSV